MKFFRNEIHTSDPFIFPWSEIAEWAVKTSDCWSQRSSSLFLLPLCLDDKYTGDHKQNGKWNNDKFTGKTISKEESHAESRDHEALCRHTFSHWHRSRCKLPVWIRTNATGQIILMITPRYSIRGKGKTVMIFGPRDWSFLHRHTFCNYSDAAVPERDLREQPQQQHIHGHWRASRKRKNDNSP